MGIDEDGDEEPTADVGTCTCFVRHSFDRQSNRCKVGLHMQTFRYLVLYSPHTPQGTLSYILQHVWSTYTTILSKRNKSGAGRLFII